MNKVERVRHILLRLRSEQIQPDNSDMLLFQAYIDSKISLADLLNHARQFATEAHYREWMCNSDHLSGDDMERADAEDQFLIEIESLMKRKHLGGKA